MKIKKGDLFAVQAGDYVGQMFAVVDLTKDVVDCLSVPSMQNVIITKEKFDFGRNNGIIEYVETLTTDVFTVIHAQYTKNANINHRFK
tara:strand:+ start:1379 stop:1642 length:264 start_codon:yes stop_codon:yes gene_type:complete